MNARLLAYVIAFLGCERTYEVVEPIYDSCEYQSWVETMHPGADVNLVIRQDDGIINRVELAREEGELRYVYEIDQSVDTWYLVEVDDVVHRLDVPPRELARRHHHVLNVQLQVLQLPLSKLQVDVNELESCCER